MRGRNMTTALVGEVTAQLTATDLAILRSAAELRFVSGSQLTRLHFGEGSTRAARRALLRLTRLGVLERLPRSVGGVRAGSAGFVYRPGRAGQRIALGRGWTTAKRPRLEVPGVLFVRHALTVAELHTRLAEADRRGEVELLEAVAEPRCWRTCPGLRSPLKPDSYVRLGVGDFEDSYFIEVDMGTEGSGALLRQLRAYAAFHDSGTEQAERGVFPKVLWLTPDSRRAVAIEGCVRRLPHSAQGLFQVALFAEAVAAMGNTLKEVINK